jgi:hypothetical protein
VKRLLRGVLAVALLGLAAAVASVGGALWLVSDAGRVQRVIDWSLRDTGVAVRVGDGALVPGRLPWTWRLGLDGVAVVPDDPDRPRLSLDHIELRVPRLLGLLTGRIGLGDVELQGLHIEIPTRRARELGPELVAAPLRLGPVILADSVRIVDALVHAPEDPPLPSLDIRGLEGELQDFGLRVGAGPLRGTGVLRAARYRGGAVRVDDIVVESVRLHGEGLDLHAARFRLAGGRGTGKVDIVLGEARPRIHVVAQVEEVDLQQLVRQATGTTPPVAGRLDGSITVRAGGGLPPGGAVTRAEVTLEDGRVAVADRLGPGARAVLKILPWITLKNGHLELGPTEGLLELRRGEAKIEHLVHRHKRDLELWGVLGRREVDLIVHLHKRRGDKVGTGLVIQGRPGELELRRAKKTELER